MGFVKATVDEKAFEILVRTHHRRVMAYALALVSRDDVAEDLVQEAFLVAHRDLAKFDPSRDFGAWVRGIVRMKYLEWARSRRVQILDASVLESIEQHYDAWDHAVEDGREDALQAVRECIRRLSDHLGLAVELFYTRRQSCLEIAARLGTSEPVVRKRLQRARDNLAACIRQRLSASGGIR